MKKGQTFTGKVIRLDFPNRGIVETDEGFCTVKNVLPGQEITFTVKKTAKNTSYAEGRLVKVDTPSPYEIKSPCSHFGKCGGCLMQNLPYETQLKIKEEQLVRLLELETFEGIIPSPRQFAYRNKMEFSFGDEYKNGPLALGMHCRDSFYDIVTCDDCRIVDEDFRKILKVTCDYFAKGYQTESSDVEANESYTYYHRIKHTGYLRHLLIRKASYTGEILVGLVTTSKESGFVPKDHNLLLWKEGLLNLELTGRVNGIVHIINDSVADVIKADEVELLYGKDWFYEEILGLRFKITAFSFFQTNTLGAEVLYQKVREYTSEVPALQDTGRKPIIYDLYCGTGTITQLLAPVADKIIGVDIVEEAITAARENAQQNGLHNCEFICGDVFKVLDEIKEKPDFIVLDPPRDGIHPKALKKIIAYDIPYLIYISCKPTSLSRDLTEFYEAGYTVTKAVAVDMFPATGNVETVCLLARVRLPTP